ncbi:MAG: hypothetical protein RL038_516 [Actinomycetota bacterium]
MKTRNLFAVVIAAAALVLSACSSNSADSPLSPENNQGTVVIDVRTPEEFNSGHVEGALNISVEDPNFQNLIATLDPNADYLVYCRSGNRSAVAIDIMQSVGFTSLLDGGAFTSMQSLGWPTA